MIVKPLTFQTAGALSVIQFASSHQDGFAYVPADIAIANKQIEVRETSEAGSVNSLIVLNMSDAFVFLMDGDILAGAKQNRVLNTSVLLAPHSKTLIPVSCVEHGRWHHVSDKFSPTDYCAPSALRKLKTDNVSFSLNESSTFDAGQSEVWQKVDHYAEASAVHSPTANFSDVYEATRGDVERAVTAFKPDTEANGAVFFHGKKIVHADYFGAKNVYAHYFPKLIKGVAMEFVEDRKPKGAVDEAEAKYVAVEFIDGWEAAAKEAHAGAGLGTEKRATTKLYSGMQLEYNDHLIHASVFTAAGGPASKRPARRDDPPVSY